MKTEAISAEPLKRRQGLHHRSIGKTEDIGEEKHEESSSMPLVNYSIGLLCEENGGRGIGMFTIGGLTLMLAAAILLYTHSKRRQGESTFS